MPLPPNLANGSLPRGVHLAVSHRWVPPQPLCRIAENSVIAVPLSLFRGIDNNCHLVLDGQLQQEATPLELEVLPEVISACRCALAAAVFDGFSTYLTAEIMTYLDCYG